MRPSSYIIRVPLPDDEACLLFHGYTGAVDRVHPDVAAYLDPGTTPTASAATKVSPSTVDRLRRRGYLTDRSREEERAYVRELGRRVHRVLQRRAAPGVLILPTYGCNLRCTYCYERNLQARGEAWLSAQITVELAEAAFAAVDRIGGTGRRTRALTFYGGEPLQRRNERIVHFLHSRAIERGYRHFSAITNGVDLHAFHDLLGPPPKISFLQITLDGPGPVHDRRRFLPDGTGTFLRIMRNVGMALEAGVRLSVRVNVDRSNADHMLELRERFEERGWTRSPRFRAYCSPVHGGVCGNSRPDLFASHLDMEQDVDGAGTGVCGVGEPAFLVASFTDAVRKRVLAHIQRKTPLPSWRTAFCGSNMSMLVFDPFGDIYPCWEVIGHPLHRVGTYGPGRHRLDARAAEAWHARSVVEIPACGSCAYLFFCGGGCEAFAFQRTGRLDAPHCFRFPEHFRRAAVAAYREWAAGKDRAGGRP